MSYKDAVWVDRENQEDDFEIETHRVIQESRDDENLVENEFVPDGKNGTTPTKIWETSY